MNYYRAFAFVFTSVATGLAAAVLLLVMRPDLLESPPPASPTISLHRDGGPVSYAAAVRRAAPSVVNVYATKITRERSNSLLDTPLFRRFLGREPSQPRLRRENSLGSGVIIDNNGYVLTNNHVIEGASEIQVVTSDGRSLPTRVVGTDPETDLAVLQAAGDHLPAAVLGQSDDLQVGDVVLAIGNPFAVGQTVTMGIVSATGRDQLGITNFENFIQTDAAINPGNSGGALINPYGEVVGINTAIFSESGGSHGIGFAIPVQLAKEVLAQIAEHGRVIRGWLGITGQNLTPSLAESLGVEFHEGILVSGVLSDGPADHAGIEPGDLIVSIDNEPVQNAQQMQNVIASRLPGSTLAVQTMRGEVASSVHVKVEERPHDLRP